MTIYIGSARHDENGSLSGGSKGDQTQTGTPDYSGEVSLQKFYVHKKGWDVLRLKDATQAEVLGKKMEAYCNDSNVGYDQGNRLAIMSYKGTGKTETDCSALVRRCVKDATLHDVGNFTTLNEKSTLLASGLFDYIGKYTEGMKLCTGDVLVTATKGHTVIVTSGNTRASYYPACGSGYTSIVEALKSVGETDTSYSHRVKLATANVISYTSSYEMNTKLLALLKSGKLVKA